MNVLTEKTPQHLYIEYVYSDKHDKNLIELKKKRRTILLSFLKSLLFKKILGICVNQGILKP